jgi:hypothetical protein
MLVDRFDTLFEFLATYPQFHVRDSAFYRFVEELTKNLSVNNVDVQLYLSERNDGCRQVVECEKLKALPLDVWKRVDAFVEIGTPENARAVFDHFAGTVVNIFSQKRGWARSDSIDDVTFSCKEGSVFVSAKPVMPW